MRSIVMGQFTLEDYREFEQAVCHGIQFQGVVNVLFDLRDMLSYSVDVAWEEMKFSREHKNDFGRIAILSGRRVGDVEHVDQPSASCRRISGCSMTWTWRRRGWPEPNCPQQQAEFTNRLDRESGGFAWRAKNVLIGVIVRLGIVRIPSGNALYR